MSICLFSVPSAGTRNRVDWRLLVEESIAEIEKLRTLLSQNWPTGPIQSLSCDVHDTAKPSVEN